MKSLKIVLFLFVFVTSCKKGDETSNVEKKISECFSVVFSVNADKQDDFTVYWSEDNTNVFDGTRAVWGGVFGGKDEVITIKLPEQVIPTNIRVDFGIKENKENVTLKSLKLDYYGNSHIIKGSEFLRYFVERPEIKTTIDPSKGTITFSKTPALKDGYYYYPTYELISVLKKITTQK